MIKNGKKKKKNKRSVQPFQCEEMSETAMRP